MWALTLAYQCVYNMLHSHSRTHSHSQVHLHDTMECNKTHILQYLDKNLILEEYQHYVLQNKAKSNLDTDKWVLGPSTRSSLKHIRSPRTCPKSPKLNWLGRCYGNTTASKSRCFRASLKYPIVCQSTLTSQGMTLLEILNVQTLSCSSTPCKMHQICKIQCICKPPNTRHHRFFGDLMPHSCYNYRDSPLQ